MSEFWLSLKHSFLWVSEYQFDLTFSLEINTLLDQPVISHLPSKTQPCQLIVMVDHSKQWSWVALGFLRFLISEDVLCFTGKFIGWRSGRELCVHWQWKVDLATLSWWRTASRLFAEASPWQKEDKLPRNTLPVRKCLSTVSWVYWRHLTQLWHG